MRKLSIVTLLLAGLVFFGCLQPSPTPAATPTPTPRITATPTPAPIPSVSAPAVASPSPVSGVRMKCQKTDAPGAPGTLNPYRQGTTTGIPFFGNGTLVSLTDFCLDGSNVVEYSCLYTSRHPDTGFVVNQTVFCPFLDCSNGKCKTTEQWARRVQPCNDTDGGFNEFVKGNVTGYYLSPNATHPTLSDGPWLQGNFTDYCVGSKIVEYTCGFASGPDFYAIEVTTGQSAMGGFSSGTLGGRGPEGRETVPAAIDCPSNMTCRDGACVPS